jgi:S1-C subfamily serine protease
MTIAWQVYSPLKKQVVARITTTGMAKLEKSVPNAGTQLGIDAFAANVHQMAASPEFRAAMNAAKPAPNELLAPAKNDPIALSGSLKGPKRSVADAEGSVVTILTGSGSGSGALVSDDGYILTDAHVVGDEKEVRTRWSDGIETVAQVIRVAKDRDIAIIKTNPRDRSPLPIKRGAVTPGQRVFAIGSPNGKAFQGTVSSGVISADRTIRGLRFIQSDVSISPGSSGGPLLDENGSVIGFTDLFILNEDRPAGLNFFIPVGDAMDFLNLEQK